MARHKDTDWTFPEKMATWEQCSVAVLMDIRDELKQLNRLLNCRNFREIPLKLDRIVTNTKKRKYSKKVTA